MYQSSYFKCFAATLTLQQNRTEPMQLGSPDDKTTLTIVSPNKASSTTIRLTATVRRYTTVKLNKVNTLLLIRKL